jgi:hypothetical protein
MGRRGVLRGRSGAAQADHKAGTEHGEEEEGHADHGREAPDP